MEHDIPPLAVEAKHLHKTFGDRVGIGDVSLSIPLGRIVGLIGPNGSGKTTTLKALMGLTSYQGQVRLHGQPVSLSRADLMRHVAYIADVAVLPKWMNTKQALDFMEGVHEGFDRRKAEGYLQKTSIGLHQKVHQMSKGMIVQLHLALIMSLDAKILILDEPTLGLDVLYRKQFYQSLIEDYFDEHKTIIITTHQVEEVEHLLTDVVLLHEGHVVLDESMDNIQQRFTQVLVSAEHLEQARSMKPLDERPLFGQTYLLFDGVPEEQLQGLGQRQTASLADIFVALMKGTYA